MAAQALLAMAHGSVADGAVEDVGAGVDVDCDAGSDDGTDVTVVVAEDVAGAMQSQALDRRKDRGPTWLLTQAAEA